MRAFFSPSSLSSSSSSFSSSATAAKQRASTDFGHADNRWMQLQPLGLCLCESMHFHLLLYYLYAYYPHSKSTAGAGAGPSSQSCRDGNNSVWTENERRQIDRSTSPCQGGKDRASGGGGKLQLRRQRWQRGQEQRGHIQRGNVLTLYGKEFWNWFLFTVLDVDFSSPVCVEEQHFITTASLN